MTQTILFDPLLPWTVIWVLSALSLAAVALALWKRLSGWALRGAAALVLLAALCGPVYQTEDRAPLKDIVVVLEDQTASQQLSNRPEQTTATRATLEAALAARPNTDIHWVTVDGSNRAKAQPTTAEPH